METFIVIRNTINKKIFKEVGQRGIREGRGQDSSQQVEMFKWLIRNRMCVMDFDGID